MVVLSRRFGSNSSDTPFADGKQPWNTVRPAYLQDLTNAVVAAGDVHTVEVHRVLATANPSDIQIIWDGVYQQWNPMVPSANLTYGSVVQLNIANDHPIHLHMYSMQVRWADVPFKLEECSHWQ